MKTNAQGGENTWIDKVADRFELAWRSGTRPRIEDFLGDEEGGHRRALLKELLKVERALRESDGSPPPLADEYCQRFPRDIDIVREVLEDVPPRPPRAKAVGADRNLLFGVLALQMDFITRDALIASMQAWVFAKHKSLAEILQEQGGLSETRRSLLEPLVAEHLAKHGDDVERSLAAIGSGSSVASIRADLGKVGDTDIDASLARLPADPSSTVSYVGTPSASGGRFRILRPHSKGGIGQVSVALDEELQREVAVKELQAKSADLREIQSRFEFEAKITGLLEHPGVIPIYGLGHYPDGRPFYAMRFVKGDSLKDSIKRYHEARPVGQDPGERSIAFRQLLGRFIDVCNAIAYAHSRGVLHRDLKPGNIMLGSYGETLLIDWGLAKFIGKSGPEPSAEPTLQPPDAHGETRSGSILGTPAYMSPEQAQGDFERLSPRSDVYGLGATLYHLLSGKPAFEGDEIEVLTKVREGEFDPPMAVAPAVPGPLNAVCLKAMALTPGDRHVSARELARDIERYLADEPVSAWEEPWPTRLARWARRNRSIVAAAAGLLLIAGLVFYITRLRSSYLEVTEARMDTAAALEKEEALHYFNRIILAEREWRSMNVRRAQQLLEDCPPARRGWEWNLLSRLCREDLRTIRGHQGEVWGLSVSPDGSMIASGSNDKTVKIWDAKDYRLIRNLEHESDVWAVAFSPESKHLASISATPSRPGEVRIWEAATGKVVGTLPSGNGVQASLSYSPDGSRLVSTSGDRGDSRYEVIVWDLQSATPIATFRGHDDAVNAAAFSPDGLRVASVSGTSNYDPITKNPGRAIIWDARTAATLATFLGHKDSVLAVAFSPDGRRMATGSADSMVKVWDSATAVELQTLRGHALFVNGVLFHRDGKRLASGGEDGAVKLWDLEKGVELRTYRGHSSAVSSLAFTRDGAHLISSSYDTTVKVWDAANPALPRSLDEFPTWVTDLAYSPQGDRLAVAANLDRSVTVWDPSTERRLLRVDVGSEPVWGVAYSPDGRWIAGALGDWHFNDRPGTIKIWDATDGSERLRLSGHKGIVRSVAFSPDGKLLASGGGEWQEPDVVTLWDADNGREVRSLRGHDGGIGGIGFSPDGRFLASGSGDHSVRIWEVSSGRLVHVLLGHTQPIRGVAYSPDGKILASGAEDNDLRLWDAETGHPLAILRNHTQELYDLAFHPGGNRVATSSTDGTIRLWDVASGQEVITLRGHSSAVVCVDFHPNGQFLASGGLDKSVKIWDARPSGKGPEPRAGMSQGPDEKRSTSPSSR